MADDDEHSSSSTSSDEVEEDDLGVRRTSASPVPTPQEPEDPKMALSETERTWALEVKRAVLEDEDLLPLSDFDYVKHALVADGDLQEALYRIERMQLFREAYQINQTVERAMECLVANIQQQPGFILHIDVDPVSDNSINVIDLGMFDPHVALGMGSDGKENWKSFISGLFYMKYCSQPNFATIRKGFYALADFGDVDNFNFKPEAEQKMFEELLHCYPFKWKQFLAYNTGYVATIKMTIAKKLMSEKMRRVVHLGCQIEESDECQSPTQRLRDFYMLPNLEEAYKQLLLKAINLVEQRKLNEEKFRL